MPDTVNPSYTPEKLARSHRLVDVHTPTSSTLLVGRLRLLKNSLSVCYVLLGCCLFSLLSRLPPSHPLLLFFSLMKRPKEEDERFTKTHFKNS